MPLFRDIDGRFYELPKELLDKHEVKKESMDQTLRQSPVSGVQIPRQEAQAGGCCEGPTAQPSTIILNQYFGMPVAAGQFMQPGLPSDIQLAHYGTTIDNPRE